MTEHYTDKNTSGNSNGRTKQCKKQDNALWEAVTKEITPLKNKNSVYKGKVKTNNSKKSYDKTQISDAPTNNLITDSYVSPKNTPKASNGIDQRTKQRLKRGKIHIDGKLDLHGKTQYEAYDALLEYIPTAQNAGKRCILIITGKGSPRHGNLSLLECCEHIGVLRQKTPHWLNTLPLSQYILDIQPAKQNHGGEGALYVLLKRQRERK